MPNSAAHFQCISPTKFDAPTDDTVEVCVFGRGVGEAILIHIGDGIWVAMDSVKDAEGKCAPLEYLRGIRVPVETKLRYILATHWHDDHVRGMSLMYRAAQSAELFFSIAFEKDEFSNFISANFGEDAGSVTNGVHELYECTKIQADEGRHVPNLVGSWSSIVDMPGSSLSHGKRVELRTLSPSPTDVFEFLKELGRVQRHLSLAGELPKPKRNDVAIATWLEIGDVKALFGSDLEELPQRDRGWKQVVNCSRQPSGQATLFKIPHHGSRNGHNDQVIEKYLIENSKSVLTPYVRSGLPRAGDARRILRYSPDAYTALAKSPKRYKPPSLAIKQLLRSRGVDISTLPHDVGLARFRWKIGSSSDWEVALFNGAAKLSTLRL